MKQYTLYIDESGSFNDEKSSKTASLVGGLLCAENSKLKKIVSKIPSSCHACEEYDKRYIDILEELVENGYKLVLFENKERIQVINGDITYLNILCEGIIKVLYEISTKAQGDNVHLEVLFAKRNKVDDSTQKYHPGDIESIPLEDYKTRLEEKLIIALGKANIPNCTYTLKCDSARLNNYLKIPDIICNTYYSRTSKRKFSQEEIDRIDAIFDNQNNTYVYPVFDSAVSGYLKKCFVESQYSEMIFQICALSGLSGITSIRNKLLARIELLSTKEQNILFSAVSLRISEYSSRRLFHDGIAFAENYKKYILNPLFEKYISPDGSLKQMISYWTFDTDFYILTMYDHLGNISKCNEYLEKCNSNIGAINHSWEHIDYYFKYKIRQMNCMLGQYRFDEVISLADKYIKLLKETKDLFSIIGTTDGTNPTPKSELLGKVYGVKLEALINKYCENRDVYQEAIKVSDLALEEFEKIPDIRRQMQTRSQLYAIAGDAALAYEYLMKSYDIDYSVDCAFIDFINIACGKQNIDAFSLMHYTNVLLSLADQNSPLVAPMANELLANDRFISKVSDCSTLEHPWQLILWNIGKYYRVIGRKEKYEEYCRKAIEISTRSHQQSTMYTFSISILAELLKYSNLKMPQKSSKLSAELKKNLKVLNKSGLPQEMSNLFNYNEIICDSQISRLATCYLK